VGYKHYRVYQDEAGKLVTRGGPVFGASPSLKENDMRYDDFGLELVEDDLGAMDYASLGAYDDFGVMDYPSLGQAAAQRYLPRGPQHLMRPPVSAPRAKPQVVQKTILTGASDLNPAVGTATVTIRPQFDFVAEDISFTGTRNGPGGAWDIVSIEFGDRIIFSNAQGVPIALFGTGSFIRGLVKGAAIAAGLDIAVQGNNATAGTPATSPSQLLVQVIGLKRGTSGCGPGAV